MKTDRQQTCEQLVDSALAGRVDDIRLMFQPSRDDVTLIDDGTMDTVLRIGDEEFRYTDTSDYRDEESGALDLTAFLDDYFDDMADTMRERWYEYGLSFEYVGGSNGESGYFRYLLSYGGPSEEFRFYVDPDLNCYKITFVYLDWFDGAERVLHGADAALMESVWRDEFVDSGSAEATLAEYRRNEG